MWGPQVSCVSSEPWFPYLENRAKYISALEIVKCYCCCYYLEALMLVQEQSIRFSKRVVRKKRNDENENNDL